MIAHYQTAWLATCLLLISAHTHADTEASKEDIYYYQSGWRAAQRLQETPGLTAAQIQQAVQGFEANLRNQASAYTPTEIQQAVEYHHEKLQLDRETHGVESLLAGEQYLASLKDNSDFLFLDQGLAYKIDKAGTGVRPGMNSQVRLAYIGKHIDGTEFDRSTTPAWSSIQGVLPGWRIAMLNMPAGSQWTIVIPPHLAYGERGAGDRIGPHETLIFEIQLLGVR